MRRVCLVRPLKGLPQDWNTLNMNTPSLKGNSGAISPSKTSQQGAKERDLRKSAMTCEKNIPKTERAFRNRLSLEQVFEWQRS